MEKLENDNLETPIETVIVGDELVYPLTESKAQKMEKLHETLIIRKFVDEEKGCVNCVNPSCRVETSEKIGLDETGKPVGHDCIGFTSIKNVGGIKMFNIQKDYKKGITYIDKRDNKLNGCTLISGKNGYIPIELLQNDLEFLFEYPSIDLSLSNGKTLFIFFPKAYIGSLKENVSNSEKKVFISDYEAKGNDLDELLSTLEFNIRRKTSQIKKLERVKKYE